MKEVIKWVVGRPTEQEVQRARDTRELVWRGASARSIKEAGLPDPLQIENTLKIERAFSELENSLSFEPSFEMKKEVYLKCAKLTWGRRLRHITKLASAL